MAKRSVGKMDPENRAKQFLPFAALKGLPEALAKKEKIVIEKMELSPEALEELDYKFQKVTKGKIVTVIHYCKGEYIKTTGMVARIDETSRVLQVVNQKILWDDIIDLECES